MRSARRTAALLSVAAAVLLAGCGGGPAGGSGGEPGAGPGAGFPVTITDKYGPVTIPEKPRRIVALSREEDALSLVGISVIGHWDNSFDPGKPYPWQVGKVDLSGSRPVITGNNTINYEAIAELRPDLILATTYFDLDAAHDTLSKIAPVLGPVGGYNEASYQDNAMLIARAVGEEPRMRQAVDGVQRYLDGFSREYPGLRGKTYVGAYYYATRQWLISANPEAPRARLLRRLGMEQSPKVPPSSANVFVSPERLDMLDADMLSVGTANPRLSEELKADPLFNRIPAVRDGRWGLSDQFESTAGNHPTLLNIPWALDLQRPLLAKVAGK